MDFDANGSVSFNEWVAALVRTRQDVYLSEKAQQDRAVELVVQDAMAAMDEAQEVGKRLKRKVYGNGDQRA